MAFKSPFAVRNRLIFANVISNMIGVCVVILLLDRFNVAVPVPVMDLRVWIDPLFLLLAFLTPVFIAVRYERPIRRYLAAKDRGDPVSEELAAEARRRVLNEPFLLIGLGFSVWVAAAILYTALFWVNDAPREIITYPMTLSMFTGLITTTVAFFVLEQVLQRRVVPYLFPDGGLSRTPGTIRIRIRTRLIALLFACNFIPFLVVLSITHGTPTTGAADPVQTLQEVRTALTTNAVLFLVVGLWVTLVVSGNLRRPLQEIIGVLQEVRRGRFDRSVRVTSNDEIGYTGDVINEMTQGLRERDFIKETFGRYVSREIRDEILAGRIPLDGEVKEVSVLFADLRDFTPLVESTPPREVVRIINGYFREMNEAIKAHRGLVIQFIGDEIEAVFGAPVHYEDHPDAALQAAEEMCGRLRDLNRQLETEGFAPLAHRIGIHTGSVVAANIGSPDRLAYSLVGDTVNLAARLQDLNREFGTEILLSGATRERLTGDPSLEPLPQTIVKGIQEPVALFTPARAAEQP
jgi:adenylate cyclase